MTTIGVKHVTNASSPTLTRMTTSANLLPGWNNALTRPQATALLNASFSPYSGMTRCNLWDGTVTALYGDRCYTDTDTTNMGQCMVRLPKFYYYIDTTMAADATPRVVYWISNTVGDMITREDGSTYPIATTDVHPAFQLDGVTKDYTYISAYEGSLKGTILDSSSGATIANNYTKAQFRGYAEAIGLGWELASVQCYGALQFLFVNEMATLNSHDTTAGGIGNGSYGVSYTISGASIANGNTSYGTSANSTTYMTYRGIENLWGNYAKWTEGIHTVNYRIWTHPQTATRAEYQDITFPGTGYADFGSDIASTAGSHIVTCYNSWYFFPATNSGGAAGTYFCANWAPATGNRLLYCGLGTSGGTGGGVFGGNLSTAAAATATSRTQYIGTT